MTCELEVRLATIGTGVRLIVPEREVVIVVRVPPATTSSQAPTSPDKVHSALAVISKAGIAAVSVKAVAPWTRVTTGIKLRCILYEARDVALVKGKSSVNPAMI